MRDGTSSQVGLGLAAKVGLSLNRVGWRLHRELVTAWVYRRRTAGVEGAEIKGAEAELAVRTAELKQAEADFTKATAKATYSQAVKRR